MTRESTQPDTIVVIAGSLKTNALGRAIALADVAPAAHVELWGPVTPSVWQVARAFPIRPMTIREARRAVNGLNKRAVAGDNVVVWVSKGFAWGTRIAGALDRRVTVIADFDDDDLALAQEFVSQSMANRLRLNPLRAGAPERLRRSQAALRRRADLITVSSDTLATALRLDQGYLRVPHARQIPASPTPAPPERARTVGFMGTMRPHKGLPEIIEALRNDVELRLVTFKQSDLAIPEDLGGRWTELDPQTSLAEAYSMIDASVVPMDERSAGAAVQLPAKAIDSAVHSTPIFATPTATMREFFEGAARWVDDWSTLGERIRVAKEAGDLRDLGNAALIRAKTSFDANQIKARVLDFLTSARRSAPTGR